MRTLAASGLVREGEFLGTLNIHTLKEPRAFDEEELRLLKGLADQAAQAIANARLFEQVRVGRERLQALSQRLVEAQETERRRIARELHDEIGQALTVIKINLQAAQRAPDFPLCVSHVEGCVPMVEGTLQQIRDLSLDLRPSLLDDLGLVPALRWFVDRQAQQMGFTATFSADSMERMPPEVEIASFRIAQEALTNVARHAQARHVDVQIVHVDGELELIVQDDGQGFDVMSALSCAAQGESLGLLSMQERASLVGGKIVFDSEPGRGTTVRARIPLAPVAQPVEV
jgi:signal transduction histidine kinase